MATRAMRSGFELRVHFLGPSLLKMLEDLDKDLKTVELLCKEEDLCEDKTKIRAIIGP